MSLLERWRLYQLKKASLKQTDRSTYNGYASIKRVLIVFDYNATQLEQIRQFARKLEQEGKLVELLGCYPAKRKEAPVEEGFKLICKDELNWYGAPQQHILAPFLREEYQLFLQLAKTNQKMLPFINTQVKADLKCSIQSGKGEVFDFQIGTETADLTTVFKELEYYLHFINKAKA